MYLLPCPSCQASIAVAPSQAGDQTRCPQCQSAITIPKLGQLRQLPQESSPPGAAPSQLHGLESSLFRRAGFVILGLLATASLLVAAFCCIRWASITVPSTSEEHVAMYRTGYAELTAAELVREYEDMEDHGLDLAAPYKYKTAALEKGEWGRNASIAAAIGGVSLLGAFLLAATTRRASR